MKRVPALAALAILAAFIPAPALVAKDCLSRLSANLHPVGNSPFSSGPSTERVLLQRRFGKLYVSRKRGHAPIRAFRQFLGGIRRALPR